MHGPSLRATIVVLALVAHASAQDPPPRHVFLEGHEASAYGLALTPDGRNPIAGAEDGTIRVWDRESGEVLHVFRAHEGTVTALASSLDGHTFASVGIDGRVRLFDVPRTHPLRRFAGVPEPPTSIAVSPDGAFVAVGHQANRVRMWDGRTGQHVRDFPGVTSPIRDVVWQGDCVVAIEEGGQLRGWTAADGTAVGNVATAPASHLAFNGGGDRIALAGDDGLVRLIDWPPVPPPPLHTHGDIVTAVALSPDGKLAASGGKDAVVNLIDLATGKVAFSPEGQPGPVTTLAFTPDGDTVVSGSQTGAVKLWTTEDGSPVALLQADAGPVHAVAPHPTNGTLATAGEDGTIQLWRVPEPIGTWTGHAQAVTALAISAEGTVVSASTDKTVRLWDAENGKPQATLAEHPAGVTAVAVDAKGTRVVSGDTGGAVTVSSVEGQQGRGTWPAHVGGVTAVGDAANDGVWTAGADGFVRLWDPVKAAAFEPDAETKTAPPLAEVRADPAKIHDLVVLADGRRFLTAGEDRFVKLWNRSAESADEVRRFGPAPAAVARVAISADESLVAAGGDPLFGQKTVFVWETKSGKALQTIQAPAGVTDVAFGPRGLVVVGGADKKVRLYDGSTGLLRETIDLPAVPADIVLLDETAILVAGSDGQLHRLDTSTVSVLTGHQGAVTSLVWSQEGNELISGGADKTIRRWDVAESKPSGTFNGNPAPVVAMATSPDGGQLVVGGGDQHVRVWSFADPQKVRLDIPQPAGVLDVAVTEDRIVVGATDNRLHVWHLETGRLFEQHVGPTSAVSAVAARSGIVVSGSHDKNVQRWTPAVAGAFVVGTTPITDIEWADDDASFFLATENRVERWMLDPVERSGTFESPAPVVSISLATDRLAVGSKDGSVTIWDSTKEDRVAATKLKGEVRDVFLSPNGDNVVAAVGNEMQNLGLARGDGEAFTLEPTHALLGAEQPLRSIAWAGEARLLFGVSEDRNVLGWTVASHQPRATLTGATGPLFSVAFDPTSEVVAAGGADGVVRFFEARGETSEREPIGWIDDELGDVTAVAFASNGLFASATNTGSVRLHNLDANLAVDLPAAADANDEVESGAWRALAFDPAGGSLVAARSSSWQRWSTTTLEPIATGRGLNGTITRVVFNAAGSRIATVDTTGLLAVWNAANGDLLFHERLPFPAARDVRYLPDGTGVVVTGQQEPRPLIVTLPAGAR